MTQLAMIEAGFTVDNPLTPEGYRLAAEMIYEEYPYLRANEIQLIVKKAIKGEFGKEGAVYNRIDVSVIMIWVRKYYEERALVHEMHRNTEHEQNKHGLSEWSPETQQKAIEAREKIFAQWRKDDEDRIKAKAERDILAAQEARRLREEYEARNSETISEVHDDSSKV